MMDITSIMFCKLLYIIYEFSIKLWHVTKGWFLKVVAFCFLSKIPIISFCHYPIFMQFRSIVFGTDGWQISSLIMDTWYFSICRNANLNYIFSTSNSLNFFIFVYTWCIAYQLSIWMDVAIIMKRLSTDKKMKCAA